MRQGKDAMEMTGGRLRARIVPLADAAAALDLRAKVFRRGAPDDDAFDAGARHLLIEDGTALRGCARITVQHGQAILSGYTATTWNLTSLAAHFPDAIEVGRVCFAPGATDPDVPRLILAMLARVVREERTGILYGCSSFPANGAGLGRLAGRLAPEAWRPVARVAEAVTLPSTPGPLPPLLRSWLSLGAVVSDRAVVDRDLGTMQVFTGLPVAAIPPARVRLLAGLVDAA